MEVVRMLFVLLLTVVLFDGAITEVSKCSCEERESGSNDCSFRRKTVIQAHDLCSSSLTWKWNFRGNNLRQLPQSIPIKRKLDVSMNEFGLSKRFGNHFGRVTELDISNNYLLNMQFLQYSHQCDLRVLNISNNAITKLETDHQNCRNIIVFRIANNKLTRLTNDSFSHQELLKFLDVSGNPLTSISSNTFSSLQRLETLDISNTHLSELPMGIFRGLSLLQYLHLSGNSFTKLSMDVFSPLESLVTLYLQRNAIKELQPGIFDSLFNLKVLDLDNNRLEQLPAHLFRRLHSLEQLSARSNRLRALPSLRLCACPLRVALFADNAIGAASEDELRALWRPGFQLADLCDNPVDADSLRWAHAAPDVNVYAEGGLTKISLVVMDRGVVWVCS